MSSRLSITLRALPTMMRIGAAQSFAYRAEMIVWMLSTTMPLVSLALWHAIAAGGAVGRWGQRDFDGYFLCTFIVRQLTSAWVVWEMNHEVRSGSFSMRLLRPVSPLAHYACENIAALPLRSAIALPVSIGALLLSGSSRFPDDPWIWLCLGLGIVGAWMITFLLQILLGALCFFTESSVSLFSVWMTLYFALSGYLFPVELLDLRGGQWASLVRALPFYYQTGFPVELMVSRLDRAAALGGLGVQWLYVAGIGLVVALVWRAALRRWNAYGA